MSMKTTATWRSSPPSFGLSRSAASGDLAAHVPAEKIAHAFALAQTVDHRVETALQLTEFGAVEHHQVAPQIALLDALERRTHHPHRGRGQPGQDPHQDEPEDQGCGRHDHHADRELGLGQIPHRELEEREQGDADDRNAGTQRATPSWFGP